MSLTAKAALQRGIDTFMRIGLADPVTDAERLLACAMGVVRGALPMMREQVLDATQLARYLNALDQRELRIPISQIIGRRAFWKHDFHVTRNVLDPRPDTETLVDAALRQPFGTVLDLGTGSGCILLSLLSERCDAHGLGVDKSAEALDVARINRAELKLEARAELAQSDWFGAVSGRFDLIVSNPPYVSADAYEGLQPEVRLYEPKIALTPGGDGLEPYRIIAAQAGTYLMPKGRVMVEIGYDQGDEVQEMFAQAGFADIRLIQDINGKDRVVTAILR